jgi:hypothetical protein
VATVKRQKNVDEKRDLARSLASGDPASFDWYVFNFKNTQNYIIFVLISMI